MFCLTAIAEWHRKVNQEHDGQVYVMKLVSCIHFEFSSRDLERI